MASINDIVLFRKHSDPLLNDRVPINEIYDVKKVLGAGGFGVVCEAVRISTNTTIALKLICCTDSSKSSA